MNYLYSTPSPYIQAAMSHAVQALMSGGPLPPNCMVMSVPYQQLPQVLPQMMMNQALVGSDQMVFPQQTPYYNLSPYVNNSQPRALIPQQNYNYQVAAYNNHNNTKSKKRTPQQPHSNIYNSSSFDSYMRNLSWSRLFDHPTHKSSKHKTQQQTQNQTEGKTDDKKTNSSKQQQRSNSSTSSSSTTSDETIRRVNVTSKQTTNTNPKQQPKGSLPFKYSSDFVPGTGKQQSQNVNPNEALATKKP